MRGGIPIQGTAAGTGPQGSSCRKEGGGEERRVPGAQSGQEGFGTSHSGDEGEERGMVVKLRFSQW